MWDKIKQFFGADDAEIKQEIREAWERCRAMGASPDQFYMVGASKRGWPIELMMAIVLSERSHNEPQRGSTEPQSEPQSGSPLAYRPGGASPPSGSEVQHDEPQSGSEVKHDEPQSGSEASNAITFDDPTPALADTDLHLMLATKSGAGKSTTLKTLLYRILQQRSDSELRILDPKTTDWLGLQRAPNVVTYLMGSDEKQLDDVESVVYKVFQILGERKKACQEALMNGLKPPRFHHYYLLIDEWFSVYGKLQRCKRLNPVMGQLEEILAQGRELCVHLILVTQSHLCGEAGFSSAMRRSFGILAQGRMGQKKDIGYEPIAATIQDVNVFSSKAERERLAADLERAIAEAQRQGDRPVLLSTLGIPTMSLLPDLQWIHEVQLVGSDSSSAVQRPPSSSRSTVQSSPVRGSTTTTTATTLAEGQFSSVAALYRAVVGLRGSGWSDSRIIQEVLGFKGSGDRNTGSEPDN